RLATLSAWAEFRDSVQSRRQSFRPHPNLARGLQDLRPGRGIGATTRNLVDSSGMTGYISYVESDRNRLDRTQMSLFGPEPDAVPEKPVGRPVRMRVLITVKAAPNPSEKYGETVCVAGLRLDLEAPGWVRLYPINFRELDNDGRFKKYDVVSLMARPNPGDPRAESWRPQMDTLKFEVHLPPWQRRQQYVDEHV